MRDASMGSAVFHFPRPRMQRRTRLLTFAFIIATCSLFTLHAQPRITRVDPPHWWSGVGSDTLELLVEGNDLASATLSVHGDGVSLISDKPCSNPRYRYVQMRIAPDAPAQRVTIGVNATRSGGGTKASSTFPYEVRSRDRSKHQRIGLDARDLVYLIMADRFANGDTTNDAFADMQEKSVNRSKPYGRHGGDIAGIRRHLDHIADLGVTALWMCPLLRNDQPEASYHGYAITDHYAIDPRYGTNSDYCALVREAHARSMRVVMDVVYNHTGSMHRLALSPPDSSWFNWWPEYTQTNGREVSLYDPHAAPKDKQRFMNGWFDRHMPDVNARDPHCARYLLQNTLWWIEEADIDALRIDTYTYPDQEFMSMLNAEVRRVFPGVFLFGETWVDSHASQAYYLEDFKYNRNTYLPGSTDFQVHFALLDVLTKTSGWDTGVGRLYRVLAADYLYPDPMKEVIFLDNHDTPRILGVLNGDLQRMRLGLTLLLTLRGIPCITYGTEAGFRDVKEHGTIREDMPGGWATDKRSIFIEGERTEKEKACIDALAPLARFRRTSRALTEGKMMHIAPENGVYGYVRYTPDEMVLVAVNADTVPRTVAMQRFDDVLDGARTCTDVQTSAIMQTGEILSLPPLTARVLAFTPKRGSR